MKKFAGLSVLILFALAGLAAAQTAETTSGPSKVEGKPHSTPSGVEYWDIVVGTGASAVAGKTVGVHYTGWLTDGTSQRGIRNAWRRKNSAERYPDLRRAAPRCRQIARTL